MFSFAKKIFKKGILFLIFFVFKKISSFLIAPFVLSFNFLWGFGVKNFLNNSMFTDARNRTISFRPSVFIVGSGPSLDELDISKIHNSTVLLLNNSWRLYDRVPNDNDVYFFCQDIKVLNELISGVSKSLNKIIFISNYSMSFNVLYDIWNNYDKYYLVDVPSFSFLERFSGKKRDFLGHVFNSKYSLVKFGGYISPVMRLGTFERNYESTHKAWLAPWTVMISAVYNSYRWGGLRIVSAGFDSSYFLSEKYAALVSVDDSYSRRIDFGGHQSVNLGRKVYGNPLAQPSSWGTYRNLAGTNLWSDHVYKALERNGCYWVNASPKTFIDSVPKLEVAEIDNFLHGTSH